jgi:hypothetical protein
LLSYAQYEAARVKQRIWHEKDVGILKKINVVKMELICESLWREAKVGTVNIFFKLKLCITLKLRRGLPDGIFSNQKFKNLGKFWRTLELKKSMAISIILWPFGNLCIGNLVYVYSPVLVHLKKENLAALVTNFKILSQKVGPAT